MVYYSTTAGHVTPKHGAVCIHYLEFHYNWQQPGYWPATQHPPFPDGVILGLFLYW
ncbi:MAG: hypothetical protein KDE09_05195 [Anaerolineales bacterium]|nr:hypothetical protein [Anaerolineales bacterium]MCB0017165.1 hypothetical protein [Anaerolineales bacterium]MCB0027489.1 hypothetical protein [Anaerolineales bacterium]MCB8958846.1 hypothetical protein [Ardenticatenales bacterium]